MSILRLINSLQEQFESSGIDNPKRLAEELLAHVIGCKPLEIYLPTEPLTNEQADLLETLAARVESHEPLQYVIGHVDFMGLEIQCDPRALIPRPETEQLVEEVLNAEIWNRPSPAVVDVGTGSGCIILALASHHPEARCTAVDVSPAALELARENAARHQLQDEIEWRTGHLLNDFEPQSFDAVVANLPYITTHDWQVLSSAVRDHEPRSALDSGPSGMELIEALAAQAYTVLRPGGMIFLEYGFDQGAAVKQCLDVAGYPDVRIKQDLSGHDRMAIAVKR